MKHNMARWIFAGSLGGVVGPLALGGILLIRAIWRELFFLFSLFAVILVALAWRFYPPKSFIQANSNNSNDTEDSELDDDTPPQSFKEGVIKVWTAIRHPTVFRWLILLQFSDLLLDIFYAFLALYFVDVAKVELNKPPSR